VNITTPLISAGSTYEVAISEFDDGDLVGLQLMTSPSSKTKKDKEAPSLFFSSAPRPLYTFRPFDALVGNQTWGWRVSSLTFRGMGTGPFFLKAFDVLEPRRFVLSQAFELEGTTATAWSASGRAKAGGKRNTQTSSTTTTTRAEHIVRRLSGHFSGNEEEQKDEGQRHTRKLEEKDKSSSINLISMMSTLLVSPKSKETFSTTGDLWKALLALPSSQGALKNSAIARQLLERAPVLQTAPAVLALDENGGAGWKKPLQVQAAMGKAIADFMDMSLSVLQQQRRQQQQQGGAGAMFGQQEEQWSTKILESLTPEEDALAGRVAQEGDVESMNVLMDSHSARRFGGMTMARLKKAGVGEEIKKMLGSTTLFRELIDDPELWETLGVGEVDAASS
jgi:hypothetical protein